jgi:hypothetical protein
VEWRVERRSRTGQGALAAIRAQLLDGTVPRVEIPKASGGTRPRLSNSPALTFAPPNAFFTSLGFAPLAVPKAPW